MILMCDCVLDMAGAVVVVFLLAILYEGLKTFREYLVYRDWKHWNDHQVKKSCQGGGGSLDSLDEDDDVADMDNSCSIMLNKKKRRGYVLNRAPNKG